MLEIFEPGKPKQPNKLRLVEHPNYTDRIYLALVDDDSKLVTYLLAINKNGTGFYRVPVNVDAIGIIATDTKSSPCMTSQVFRNLECDHP